MSVEPSNPASVEELVAGARAGNVSRRGFIAAMSAAGASAVGMSVLLAATRTQPASTTRLAPAGSQEAANLAAHDDHLAAQMSSDPSAANADPNSHWATSDYHPNAVVEDVGHGTVTGQAAIVARKQAQAKAVANPVINILNRFPFGQQVVAEWEVVGTHVGDYLGFKATGRSFSIRGLTVVTRQDGKIVKESIYYDPQELQRQLAPVPVS